MIMLDEQYDFPKTVSIYYFLGGKKLVKLRHILFLDDLGISRVEHVLTVVVGRRTTIKSSGHLTQPFLNKITWYFSRQNM